VYYDRAERTQAYIQPTYDTLDAQVQHTLRSAIVTAWCGARGFALVAGPFHRLNGGHRRSALPHPPHLQRFPAGRNQNRPPSAGPITAGSKLEWNDFTGTEIQPRLNTALSLSDDHTVWGAVSRAVRTPSQVEDTGAFRYLLVATFPATIFGVIRGNSELKAESLMAYELGYRGRPTPRTESRRRRAFTTATSG
jgi:iron complex outermembrane receptor protein